MTKVGLVGVGYWGKNLARNFHQLGALHCVYDSGPILADLSDEVIRYSSLEALLADPEVTAVAVAVPAEHHYDVAVRALEMGKDLYVEKPLCLSLAQGEELADLAEVNGRILMVGHLLQYHPCVRKVQEMVAGGAIGQLQYILSNRLNLGKIRKEENALWSLAPHDFSVVLSLVGDQMPHSVQSTGGSFLTEGVADSVVTSLSFENGIHAHVHVSWLHPFKEQKLSVIGTHGMLVFDDTLSWDQKLVYTAGHLSYPGAGIPVPSGSAPEPVEVEYEEPLKAECAHFLECCERRIPARTDGREGLRVLELLHMAQRSLDGEEAVGTIEAGASVGAGTKVWHYSRVMQGAVVGAGCNLGQNVVVHSGALLGRNVKVQNNVSLYSGVEVEDDVFIGPSAVFTNIKNPRSAFVRRDHYLKTVVRRGSTIGANATILCGIELGEHSFVAAGSVVTSNIAAYALMCGSPARQIGWISRAGHRLDLPLETAEPITAACPETGELYELDENGSLTYLGAEAVAKR